MNYKHEFDFGNLGFIKYLGNFNDESDIVRSARISFDNFEKETDSGKDARLIKRLIKDDHKSPIRCGVLQFYVKAPLYIASQWQRHIVASTYIDAQNGYNQKSHRYRVANTDELYLPEQLFYQSKANKQMSGDALEPEINEECRNLILNGWDKIIAVHKHLIDIGVSREQANRVLPHAMMTSFTWVASLETVFNFVRLRMADDSQAEINTFARAIDHILSLEYPNAHQAFTEKFKLERLVKSGNVVAMKNPQALKAIDTADNLKEDVEVRPDDHYLLFPGFDKLFEQETGWTEQFINDNPEVRVVIVNEMRTYGYAPTSIIDAIPFRLIEFLVNFLSKSPDEKIANIAKEVSEWLSFLVPLLKFLVK